MKEKEIVKPYVHQDYPALKYKADGSYCVVESKAHAESLDDEWSSKPPKMDNYDLKRVHLAPFKASVKRDSRPSPYIEKPSVDYNKMRVVEMKIRLIEDHGLSEDDFYKVIDGQKIQMLKADFIEMLEGLEPKE